MPLIVSTETNQQISLTDQPFASGGEGELYKVISPNSLSNYCVKIFYSQYQTQKKAEKLRFMIKNKPDSVGNDNDISICWPVDLIFIQSGFVGFLMPLAFNDSIQLYELCTPKLKKNLSAIWHQKFDRSHDESVKNRIKLCINLAIAIFNIHKVGNYVLVDMKPQNILITADGKVSIVDLDSIQIANKTQVIHNGHVATPEYTPPEGAKLNPSTDYIPETWDRFSLAVIYYELLFGVHPFVSTSTGPYEHITTIDESIKNGLFVFGNKSQYINAASFHNNFQVLPQNIKSYFLRALDRGHINFNERPTAEEWGKVLYNELRLEIETLNINCPVCTQSIEILKHKNINTDCPNCATKIEAKNGNIVGYIGKEVITVEKYNPLLIILSISLGIIMLFGYIQYGSLQRSNQELENKNQNLNQIVSKISSGQPFIIEYIHLMDSNDEVKDFSNKFSYRNLKYIYPIIKIITLPYKNSFPYSARIYVKHIEPNGLISRNPNSSPEGYTYISEQTIESNTDHLVLEGWGSDTGGAYEIGIHRVEIWLNDKLVGMSSFEVTY